MIGGDKAAVDRLIHPFALLSPGGGDIAVTLIAAVRDPYEHGYALRAERSRAFAAMIHND